MLKHLFYVLSAVPVDAFPGRCRRESRLIIQNGLLLDELDTVYNNIRIARTDATKWRYSKPPMEQKGIGFRLGLGPDWCRYAGRKKRRENFQMNNGNVSLKARIVLLKRS